MDANLIIYEYVEINGFKRTSVSFEVYIEDYIALVECIETARDSRIFNFRAHIIGFSNM